MTRKRVVQCYENFPAMKSTKFSTPSPGFDEIYGTTNDHGNNYGFFSVSSTFCNVGDKGNSFDIPFLHGKSEIWVNFD